MKLIVGLGNPGTQYEKTRHNVGFMVLDRFCKKHSISLQTEKMKGIYGTAFFGSEKFIFLKPQKYMNLSGEVVRSFQQFFKIEIEDILILHDDLDLPVGMIRLKQQGGSGGHNGLKNIELHLGTKQYKRMKIGISNNKLIETKDYVLGTFTAEEREVLDQTIETSIEILDKYVAGISFDQLMNIYNTK